MSCKLIVDLSPTSQISTGFRFTRLPRPSAEPNSPSRLPQPPALRRSAYSPAMSTLPLELVLQVFSNLHEDGDLSSLARCCRVAQAWLQPAQKRLYQVIQFELHPFQYRRASQIRPRWEDPTSLLRLLTTVPQVHESSGEVDSLGVPLRSPLAALSQPHIAQLAHAVSFAFSTASVPPYGMGSALYDLEESLGEGRLTAAVARFIGEVADRCCCATDMSFLQWPAWGIRAIRDALEPLRYDPILRQGVILRCLRIEVYGEEDDPTVLQPAELAKLLSCIWALTELELSGFYGDLSGLVELNLVSLRSLKVSDDWTTAVDSLLANSWRSLASLTIVQTLERERPLDLSQFGHLQTVELLSKEPEDYESPLATPLWIPPSPSAITSLSLSTISVYQPLPPIPTSVEHLTLGIILDFDDFDDHGDFSISPPLFREIQRLALSHTSLRTVKVEGHHPDDLGPTWEEEAQDAIGKAFDDAGVEYDVVWYPL